MSALLLASCGSDTDEGQDAQPTGAPEASASVAATDSPTASPSADAFRTDYEVLPWGELVAMYEYDTSEPLDYQVIEEKDQEWMRQWDMDPSSATVYDVGYQSSGYTVPAWLVIPEGQGPFPAVLYAHGRGVERDMHLAEAVALARKGYVGLAITGPEAREPYAMFWTGFADQDIAGEIQYVTDLRRGIDLLGTLPEVDASRLGLAGLSLGCEVGSILSGLEDRIDAYVLMSCVGYSTDPQWSGIAYTGEALTRYQDETAVLNPVNYVAHKQGADDLQASIRDRRMRPLREQWYEASLHMAIIDTAQPRIAATRLRDCVTAILARVGKRTGSAISVDEERPWRPAVAAPPDA